MKRVLALSLLSVIASAHCAAQTIHLKKGDLYILKLESNPTTGFMWELTSLDKENKVQVEELPFKSPNSDLVGPLKWSTDELVGPLKKKQDLVGQGGTQSWKITAIGNGHTRAIFDYKHCAASNSIKTEIFDFIVE